MDAQLIDAEHVRPGFRAFRTQCSRLEFRLGDLATGAAQPTDGCTFTATSPGRYVVAGNEQQRVGDADVVECLRSQRPSDRFLEILYTSDPAWRRAFLSYASDGSKAQWMRAKMTMSSAQGDQWFCRAEVQGERVELAFTDGGDEWDNNTARNYAVPLPGKYAVAGQEIRYLGPASVDLQRC